MYLRMRLVTLSDKAVQETNLWRLRFIRRVGTGEVILRTSTMFTIRRAKSTWMRFITTASASRRALHFSICTPVLMAATRRLSREMATRYWFTAGIIRLWPDLDTMSITSIFWRDLLEL